MDYKKVLTKPKVLLPLLVVLMTVVSHGINLYKFPYFENDEGVYTSQAWWLVRYGQLGPYTYWYDHSPFGWLQVGLWQLLTGGPFTFGFSLHSTRILMVLVAGLTNLFLYFLVNRITKEQRLAFLASFLFALSPLAIYYHRRVLLDNLATLWLVISLFFLWDDKRRLSRFWLSGLTFGLAFLSKESMFFLIPALIYAVWLRSPRKNKRYTLAAWGLSVIFLISLFPLLALVKKELFPSVWFGSSEHVSFWETIAYQLKRGGGKPFWEGQSQFREQFSRWLGKDKILVLGGLWSSLLGFVFFKKQESLRVFGLLTVFYLLFLVRGGLVLDFYITPLIPLLAVNMALLFYSCKRKFPRQYLLEKVHFYFGLLTILVVSWASVHPEVYLGDETSQQLESLRYVKAHLPQDSFIAIDNFALMDMKFDSVVGEGEMKNVDWFYKVERDPEVREEKLANHWENVKYILLSHEMLRMFAAGELPFLKEAYVHSEMIQDFPPGPKTFRDLDSLQSSNGDWATLLRVESSSQVANWEKVNHGG